MHKKEVKVSPVKNKGKGELLHQFFASEMRNFILQAEILANKVLKNPKKISDYIPNAVIVNKYFWEDINKYVSFFAMHYRDKIMSDTNIFSRFYFSEENLPFTLFLLKKYVQSDQCHNQSFKYLTIFLFKLNDDI